jgi:alpha-glucosidase
MSTFAGNWARAAFVSVACFFVLQSGAQQLTPTPAGMTMTSNGVTLEVTALRDDVLRVRIWKGTAAPEDASWAVLPSARTSRVAVAAFAIQAGVQGVYGFATGKLRVTVDDQLQLTVADLAGNVIQRDAAPVQWDGAKFKVSKQGAWSDHFFGLGDKPGPLDRKFEAFTMWNTDSFGWQESTDPIYKSIPFFIDMNQ